MQYAPCPAPLLPGYWTNGPGDDVQTPPNPPTLRASAGAAVRITVARASELIVPRSPNLRMTPPSPATSQRCFLAKPKSVVRTADHGTLAPVSPPAQTTGDG